MLLSRLLLTRKRFSVNAMSARPKILLLDDEQDLLDIYKEILVQLPGQPEIHLCNSGARALALLDSEPFTLLISDLRMPKMDGLQVISIVRRKFPQMRIVVMTAVKDEQYRSRAYALGVDLFWEKPGNAAELKLFQDCIASLLEQQEQGGFRGVQSKTLVDIIQLECLSHNSSVLKISNAGREGRIWVQDGEIIDATAGDFKSEDAFKEICSWKTGTFEILPPETNRPRAIFNSYQGLLLDSAQSLDESRGENPVESAAGEKNSSAAISPLAALGRFDGVESVLSISAGTTSQSWGSENPEPIISWAKETEKQFRALGEKLDAGALEQIEAIGLQRHIVLANAGEKTLCVGFKRTLAREQMRASMKNILNKWVS